MEIIYLRYWFTFGLLFIIIISYNNKVISIDTNDKYIELFKSIVDNQIKNINIFKKFVDINFH